VVPRTYLDRADIRVLCCVLVLVQAILCEFAFAKIYTELDKEDHHRLERGDGAIPGALIRDMFVEELQGSLRLLHSDEFLCALAVWVLAEPASPLGAAGYVQSVLGLAVRWRRHAGQSVVVNSTAGVAEWLFEQAGRRSGGGGEASLR
jgi:hypothetical protein